MSGNELAVCGNDVSVDAAALGAGVDPTLLLKGADQEDAASGSELGYASFVPVLGILNRLAAPNPVGFGGGYANWSGVAWPGKVTASRTWPLDPGAE